MPEIDINVSDDSSVFELEQNALEVFTTINICNNPLNPADTFFLIAPKV
jgi:hypothetical protein